MIETYFGSLGTMKAYYLTLKVVFLSKSCLLIIFFFFYKIGSNLRMTFFISLLIHQYETGYEIGDELES